MDTKLASLKSIATDKNKKNYFIIVKEVSTLWIKDKEFPKQYFLRLAYKKDSPNFKNFTSYSVIKNLWLSKELHSKESVEILRNKIKFNDFCQSKGISTPKLLAYNEGNHFFFDGVEIELDDIIVFKTFLEQIFEKNNGDGIFTKPLTGIQGKGCFKIKINDLENPQLVEELFNILSTSKYIIQETIKQHPAINKIYPGSVNTVRLDTYISGNGLVEILSGLMRFGIGGSIVDNASSGGFFVPVDLTKGILKSYGMQSLKTGNKTFYEHPDTLVKLAGYQIPYIDEAKDLVKKAAKELGDRLVGWDVAIAEDGPMLIEGNSNYDIGMSETAYGGYMKHEVFKEIVEKYA